MLLSAALYKRQLRMGKQRGLIGAVSGRASTTLESEDSESEEDKQAKFLLAQVIPWKGICTLIIEVILNEKKFCN